MIPLICVSLIIAIITIIGTCKLWHGVFTIAGCVLALTALFASVNINTGPYKPVTLNIEMENGVYEQFENKYYKHEGQYYTIKEGQDKKILWIPFYEVEMEKAEFNSVAIEAAKE